MAGVLGGGTVSEQLPQPGLVDSHCHLQTFTPDERERLLDEARQAGVTGFLVPAIRLDDADDVLDLARRHDDVWCALGVHPHDASTWRPGDGERLRSLLGEDGVLAMGECGLDFYYDRSPRDVQLEVMRRQWAIAIEANLPVIVHNRDSDAEMLAEVERPEVEGLRGVFHSFAAGLAMARPLIARGFYLGISGMVTFPRADNVREVFAEIPRERFLVETDTPYLAPVPHRGKTNRPAWVREVARRVADEMELDEHAVARLTGANFQCLFLDRAR